MNDLISRQAAIDALAKAARDKFNLSDEFNHYLAGLMDGEKAVRDLPAVQPERKKGKWIYYPKASGSVTSTAVHLYPVCSECGCAYPSTNYCPNCGARMGEGEQE